MGVYLTDNASRRGSPPRPPSPRVVPGAHSVRSLDSGRLAVLGRVIHRPAQDRSTYAAYLAALARINGR